MDLCAILFGFYFSLSYALSVGGRLGGQSGGFYFLFGGVGFFNRLVAAVARRVRVTAMNTILRSFAGTPFCVDAGIFALKLNRGAMCASMYFTIFLWEIGILFFGVSYGARYLGLAGGEGAVGSISYGAEGQFDRSRVSFPFFAVYGGNRGCRTSPTTLVEEDVDYPAYTSTNFRGPSLVTR